MIRSLQTVQSVTELMKTNNLDVDELVERTAIDVRIVEAIVHQRYTPSPDQRDRVSAAFGVTREQVKWGHLNVPEPHIHAPD